MKIYTILPLFSLFFITACTGGGSSNKAEVGSTGPDGAYFKYHNVSGGSYYHEVSFKDGSKFLYILAYAPSSQTYVKFRKESGSYSINENRVSVTFDYSTCYGLGSASYTISGDFKDTIGWKPDGTSDTHLFKSAKRYTLTGFDIKNVTAISEDTDCTFFTKNENPRKEMFAILKSAADRLPANTKKAK